MDLRRGPKLTPAEAAAAIIVTPDRRYLLQHRDDSPGIFFPGWLGCFGGGIEAGETPLEAIRRELAEELSWTPARIEHFASLGLDFSFAGQGHKPRHFFVTGIGPEEVAGLQLTEGQGIAMVPAAEILTTPRLIPYDATVIWQHLTRGRY